VSAGAPAERVQWRALLASILRESRSARGRLAFFIACLAIGVAAVVGVTALIAAMAAGLRESSRELLAGDLRVSARRPLPEAALAEYFADVPHRRADVLELSAMASRIARVGEPGASRLVELKVVGAGYPFYGTLALSPPELTAAELGPGDVYAGPELLAGLGLALGDELSLGGETYRIAAEVEDEPDRLEFSMTLGPRVFMSAEGLARTELLEARSRVRYSALYRIEGDPDGQELARIERDLRAVLDDPAYLRIRSHTDAQRNVRRSFRRVEEFLGLVALLSLLLGGIGVSQIVRAWLADRARSVAVMRCLGFRAREIAGIYLGHVALLALAGCIVGGAVGALLPWAVRGVAPELFAGSPSLWQPLAIARGIALGLFVAPLFSLPPLTAVWRVPPAAVLRADAVPLAAPRSVRYGTLAVLFLGVLGSARVQGGDWLVAAAFSGGLVVLAALLYGGALLATRLASRLPRGRLGPYVEHGLAALARPGSGTTGAIVALGLGVMVVLSMFLIERRLDETLRSALPDDAPSVFLVDIQPDQWEGVRGVLEARGALAVNAVPVVMARLRAIDGRPVAELAAESRARDRSSWRFTREQRLTWMDALPEDNVIVAGELWSDPDRAEVSLEEGFAEDLGVGLGAVLTFDVQGVPLDLTVTSLRTVEWESFGINFFLVVEPGLLEDAPHSRLVTARLESPAAEYALQNDLAADYPNITLLRIRPLLEKIAGVLGRVAVGVRSLGAFTILTGLVILAGAAGTSALRRRREAALLKTLGVTRGGVTLLFAMEYALSGLVAGVIGAAGALLLTWAFLVHILELEAQLPLAAVPLAALAAAVLSTASGLAASARALRARPMETLRG